MANPNKVPDNQMAMNSHKAGTFKEIQLTLEVSRVKKVNFLPTKLRENVVRVNKIIT